MIHSFEGSVTTRRGNIICSKCWYETDGCVR